MAGKQYSWQTIQIYIWLALAVVCLFVALLFWVKLDKYDFTKVNQTVPPEVELHIQPEKVASMTHLGALTDEVKPLDMTVRVAITAQHEAEFRGSKFLQDNANKYVIELFRVSNEDIVKSFLRKQADRKPLSYIRLSGENQVEQYVVLFGVYRTELEAKKALSTLSLGLPSRLKPQPKPLKGYAAYVNDLGSDELNTQKIYTVKLKTAAVPVVDETVILQRRAAAEAARAAQSAPVVTPPPRIPTTSTTVTRRDAAGNVVDVQKSQTHESTAPKVVQEINDPFN